MGVVAMARSKTIPSLASASSARLRRSRRENDLVDAQKELDDQREKMTRAWQDLEVLKKLKARQMESWSVEMLRLENLELDEVGIQRADHQRREKLASV